MLFDSLKDYLDRTSEESTFKVKIETSGGYIIFSNSGQRGGRKYFNISLISIKNTLNDILKNYNIFEKKTSYIEEEWRDLSQYYSDETMKSVAAVQTKPLFTTFSKIINWANDNINKDESVIDLNKQSIEQTIKKLEELIKYFTPNELYSREDEFREYLQQVVNQRGNKFTINKINEFINDLRENIPNEIGDKQNLLEINDIKKLNLIKKRLNDTSDPLNSFNNKEGNGRPSNAVYQYISFLNEIGIIEKDIPKKTINIILSIFSNEAKGNIKFPYKNILFKGVPGTGKSRAIDKIINEHLGIKNEKENILRINIHSASSNSDLMQGIGISTSENGNIKYSEKQGLILDIIKRATFHPNQPFVLILEEIQENSLNELIGDLIYLIEDDKRAKLTANNDEYKSYEELVDKLVDKDDTLDYVEIPYLVNDSTKYKKMIMPDNLFIFCTSNYRDDKKVIEDNLLRRFEVIEIYPKKTVVNDYAKDFFDELNKSINAVMDKQGEIHPDRFMIGHAIWKDVVDKKTFYKAFSKLITEFKDIREVEFDTFKSIVGELPFPDDVEVQLKDNYYELIKDIQTKIGYEFIN